MSKCLRWGQAPPPALVRARRAISQETKLTSSGQLLEQCLRLCEVFCVEAFGEAVMDRFQRIEDILSAKFA
jgi:hypothetical protein